MVYDQLYSVHALTPTAHMEGLTAITDTGASRRVLPEGLLGKRLSVLATPTHLVPLGVRSHTGTSKQADAARRSQRK